MNSLHYYYAQAMFPARGTGAPYPPRRRSTICKAPDKDGAGRPKRTVLPLVPIMPTPCVCYHSSTRQGSQSFAGAYQGLRKGGDREHFASLRGYFYETKMLIFLLARCLLSLAPILCIWPVTPSIHLQDEEVPKKYRETVHKGLDLSASTSKDATGKGTTQAAVGHYIGRMALLIEEQNVHKGNTRPTSQGRSIGSGTKANQA